MNPNKITKLKHYKTFTITIIFIAALILIVYIYSITDQKSSKPKKIPAPDMTGVVDVTFNTKLTDRAIADAQQVSSYTKKEMSNILSKINELEDKINNKDEQIKQLNFELEKVKKEARNSANTNNNYENDKNKLGEINNNGVPLPTNFYSIDNPNNRTPTFRPMPEEYTTEYTPKPKIKQGSSSITFSYSESKNLELPYIPSGSFSNAIIIEGADTNASVTGKNDPSPMQFRLIGKLIMPNDNEFDLDGCFVTAAAWGDISSERARARTNNISCNKNGVIIDMPFEGHVTYAGKNGIKGEPVMRNGKIIGWAGAAGFIDGIGEGAKSASQKTVGVGGVAGVSGSDVLKNGLGGGASQAAKTLSEYYIKRAEQYHPIIPIGAGDKVTIVFQKGFKLKSVDEMNDKNKKNNKTKTNNDDFIIKEIKKQSEQLNINDFISLNNK